VLLVKLAGISLLETPRPEMNVARGSFYAFSGGLSIGIRQAIICEPLV